MATYNWYPGHMAKAKRAMMEDIKLIDLIAEIVDARAPFSTRNPDIGSLGAGKERIIILNKADLADEKVTEAWVRHFEEDGLRALAINSRDRKNLQAVKNMINDAASAKRERDLKRGIRNRPARLLVAGIPNVGKSTFINALCGRNIAKTGNKPGVTKGKQWLAVAKGVDLMDTPGILWPRIEDPTSQKNLALIGSMNDEAINMDELYISLAGMLVEKAGSLMEEKFDVRSSDSPEEILLKTAGRMSMLGTGGVPDTERAKKFLFTSYRAGELGRISLEEP